MNDDNLQLSEQGALRRDQIRQAALAAGRRRRWRRRVVIAAPIAATMLLAGLGSWSLMRTQPREIVVEHPLVTTRIANETTVVTVPVPMSKSFVTVITNSPDTLRTYTQPTTRQYVTIINDDQLIARMTEAGHPIGLAYLDGRVQLLPR